MLLPHHPQLRRFPTEPNAGSQEESYELDSSGPASGSPPGASPPGKPPSLLEGREDPCPSCGKLLDQTAVLCIHCGYDLRTNTKLRTETGVVEVLSAEDQAAADELAEQPFVMSKAAGPRWFVIGGLIASVIAVVAAGINTAPQSITEPILQRSPMVIPLRVLLAGLDVAMLTAAGIASAYLVGIYFKRKFGSSAGVAARVFLATACFLAVWNQHIPIPYLGHPLKIVASIGVYLLVAFLCFRKDLGLVRYLALAHLAVAVLLSLQSYLWSSVYPFVMR
jgi:uncharacterized integral membrane protein